MNQCLTAILSEDVSLEIAATSAGSGELYYNLWALLDIDGVCQQHSSSASASIAVGIQRNAC
ncbi:hypothetical protein D4764_09G0009910 [Takifugu flavidus]|uniref:Uncharacterized protein n=1 Tax=Takifugu flavidus TaxID=433684 RepID=A0A5C6MP19_9TELE|nr:hypothetical protein D4764_09G0009910 [Takifugu flavidus]